MVSAKLYGCRAAVSGSGEMQQYPSRELSKATSYSENFPVLVAHGCVHMHGDGTHVAAFLVFC